MIFKKNVKVEPTIYLRKTVFSGKIQAIEEDELKYVADSDAVYKIYKVTGMEELEITLNVKKKE